MKWDGLVRRHRTKTRNFREQRLSSMGR
jgi:hypothetical protein